MIRNFKLLAQIVILKSHLFYFEEEIIFICRRKNPENTANLKVLSLQTFFMFYLSQYGLFGKFRAKIPSFRKSRQFKILLLYCLILPQEFRTFRDLFFFLTNFLSFFPRDSFLGVYCECITDELLWK